MKEITNGPGKEGFIKAFADRQAVTLGVEGDEEELLIDTLQHEGVSAHIFNFVMKGGAFGRYNTRTKTGEICFVPKE